MTMAIPTAAVARWPALAPSTCASRSSMPRSCTTTNSHGCRFPALPDQRATSRMSCNTSSAKESGRSCRVARRLRRNAIRPGTARVPRATLLPALEEIGWQPSDLRVIINTHLHIDHAGGNADMLEASGAGIHIHRADAELTDRDKYLEKYCRDALRLMGQAD